MTFEDEEDWFYQNTFHSPKTNDPKDLRYIYADQTRMSDNFYALCDISVEAQDEVERILWSKPLGNTTISCAVFKDTDETTQMARAKRAAEICNRWDVNGWTYIAT